MMCGIKKESNTKASKCKCTSTISFYTTSPGVVSCLCPSNQSWKQVLLTFVLEKRKRISLFIQCSSSQLYDVLSLLCKCSCVAWWCGNNTILNHHPYAASVVFTPFTLTTAEFCEPLQKPVSTVICRKYNITSR
jgi:hypothetical protein